MMLFLHVQGLGYIPYTIYGVIGYELDALNAGGLRCVLKAAF